MIPLEEAVNNVYNHILLHHNQESLRWKRWFLGNRLVNHYDAKGVNDEFIYQYFPLTEEEINETATLLPNLQHKGKKRSTRRD